MTASPKYGPYIVRRSSLYLKLLTDVIVPERNRSDLADVPADVRRAVRFHPVMSLHEVLELALEPAPARDVLAA